MLVARARRAEHGGMDLHQGFRDPAQADTSELTAFLEAVDRLPGVQAVQRALRAALALRPGMRLLDAGCGIGLETRRLAALHPDVSVTGLDRNRRPAPARRGRRVGARRHPRPAGGPLRRDPHRARPDVPPRRGGRRARRRGSRPGGVLACFELDYGATILAPGSAPEAVVERAGIALSAALPQPWAGRRLPGADGRATASPTSPREPFSFAVTEPVWRRIVHDSLQALDAGICAWLDEQREAAARGEFVAAFTGILSTGRRARFRARSAGP